MDKILTVRAIAHVHSDWSYDGVWPLSRIARFFRRTGYRVVLTSEHDVTFDDRRWQAYQEACRKISTDKLLIVPGVEYSDEQNTIHTLVWGVDSFLGKHQPTEVILRKARAQNGICVMAHPSRRDAWRQIEPGWLSLLDGMEMWNRKADGIAPSAEAVRLLERNRGLYPFVGLDFHRSNQAFPLSMLIRVNDPLSTNNVVNAMRGGYYRASAFGLPVSLFSVKPLSWGLSGMETLRRVVAAALKRGRKK